MKRNILYILLAFLVLAALFFGLKEAIRDGQDTRQSQEQNH